MQSELFYKFHNKVAAGYGSHSITLRDLLLLSQAVIDFFLDGFNGDTLISDFMLSLGHWIAGSLSNGFFNLVLIKLVFKTLRC